MGTSGVTTACFTFDVLLSEFPEDSIAGGSEVIISGAGTRTFYVSSTSSENGIVSVTCYDKMLFTECDFPCSDEDFPVDEDGVESEMDISVCLERIANICGFRGCFYPADVVGEAYFQLPKSSLSGRSCRDVLSIAAEAVCGYWVCQSTSLFLIALGASNNMTGITSASYHEKFTTSKIQISSVCMTDGDYVYGNDTGTINTIKIDTPAASLKLYDAVSKRLNGYSYKSFKCSHALLDTIPEFPAEISFKGAGEMPVNNFDISFSSAGIIASVGNNSAGSVEWKYRSRREIEQRYKEGETWSNIEITKNGGFKTVYRNENNGKKKYGIEVKDEGVTLYEGTDYSKTPASEISVSEDFLQAVYKTGKSEVLLSLVWNGDVLESYKRIIQKDGKTIYSDEEVE